MKYIVKNNEPQSLIDWKKNDKMFQRGKPDWKRFKHSKNKKIQDELIESLKKEQGYICCYCERELIVGNCHIEHLKPKATNKYPELQLEYNNLLCSCQLEIDKGEPRHCGNSKGSWYDDDLLISPLDADCEIKFKYFGDGNIDHINKASEQTIIHLQLGIDKLIALRKGVIDTFIFVDPVTKNELLNDEDRKEYTKQYLQIVNGKVNEFYTTIKYLFE
ncbi:MAG: TIGR02646 family protein [Candidatus Cloacimonetes bacterium]|nr:TIGR02646 family protein [Candidatus Cloacimonadota bacterium]